MKKNIILIDIIVFIIVLAIAVFTTTMILKTHIKKEIPVSLPQTEQLSKTTDSTLSPTICYDKNGVPMDCKG